MALKQNTTLHSSRLKTGGGDVPGSAPRPDAHVGMSWAQCPHRPTRSAAAAAALTAPFLESADEKSCNCREDRMPAGQPIGAIRAALSCYQPRRAGARSAP